MILWAAFLIGFLGSFHCIGMCGPIAIALPMSQDSWFHRFYGAIVYNAGRLLTYMVLGATFGLLGKGLHLAGFQLWASVVIGAMMISLVLFQLIFGTRIKLNSLFNGYTNHLFVRFRGMFQSGSSLSLLGIGLLNGILPCGLVYVGVAGAINTGDVFNAAAYMLVFGAGTVPIMLTVALIGNFISLPIRKKVNKITPYVVIFLGVLFILRGLSLGIPYISPNDSALAPEIEKANKCCHK
jgi:sulfite exporter TauE/SafE